MIDAIKLKESPGKDWEKRRRQLLKDPWLKRKTDRLRRLREHAEYLQKFCPEIVTIEPKGLVIDIGPGPGELLEIARYYGHEVMGIDAEIESRGGMGNEYLEYSQLMAQRQDITVHYCGFLWWMDNVLTFGTQQWHEMPASCVLINSRGSIEQTMCDYMDGVPHDVHHDCKLLSWRENGETADAFEGLFVKIKKLLRPGCSLLINANGAANVEFYDKTVLHAAERVGLRLVMYEAPTLHKWVKP